MKLIVIGISGISGGGKSTLATALHQFLSNQKNSNTFDSYHINRVMLIQQDKYFYPRDSANHTWIPEINFINRELMSAMDMAKCAEDVTATVAELKSDRCPQSINEIGNRININILLIEGFLIYNDRRVNEFCQLRFHIHLTFDVGYERRLKRSFKHVNPNPEWYYANYLWPSYQKHLEEVPNKSDLIYLNGEHSVDKVFDQTYSSIAKFLETIA